MDRLDYIEKQAERLASFRLETMELLNKRAHTLVTLLLGGAGAAAAFCLKTFSDSKPTPAPVVYGLGCAALWLFLIAALAIWKCLMTGETHPPGEEPMALLNYAVDDFEELRHGCLRTLDWRTKVWAIDNTERGVWLNYCYLGAVITPIVATAGAAGLVAAASLFVRA